MQIIDEKINKLVDANTQPLLTIDVKCLEGCYVRGSECEINMIPFTCVSKGPLFSGKSICTGVDTQKKTRADFVMSARYMLDGVDFMGESCKVFVENQGSELSHCKPMIVTDSKALAFMENITLKSVCTLTDGGVTVKIYKE